MLQSLKILFLTPVKYTVSDIVCDAAVVINSCSGFFYSSVCKCEGWMII